MTDFFKDKVTIYNDIPADTINQRSWHRYVIDRCNIQSGYVEKADGTISKVVNGTTVITKDTEHYKSPEEYKALPADEKGKFYTVQTDDFVVLAEVSDAVTTATEWAALKQKYKRNGISVTSVNAYIFGTSTDNVSITHA